MNPAKEKAQELVNKFNYDNKHYLMLDAKQCALIAVDEILNNFGLHVDGKLFYISSNGIEFYHEVKQEIEKL